MPIARLLLLSALWAFAAAAADPLSTAAAEVKALKYKNAAHSLTLAEAQSGLSPEQVKQLYELKGVVAGTLNDEAGAREAFTRLLTLDPGYRLNGRFSPRVTTPFYDAKSAVAESGGLKVEHSAPDAEPGKLKGARVAVSGDSVKLVVGVVVHLRPPGGPWSTVALGPQGGEVPVSGSRVDLWVELKGPRDWVLRTEGTEAAPLAVEAPPVVVAAPPPPPPPAELLPHDVQRPLVVAQPVVTAPRFRPAAYTLFGVGVASLGVGAYFGVMSSAGRQKFASAQTDANGVVTSMTRQDALTLDATVRQQALIADVLFAAGGALAASGAGLWVAGTVSPSTQGGGGGVVIGGRLP